MVRPDMAFGPLGGVVCRQRTCSQLCQRDRRDEHLIGQCRRIQTLQVDDGVGVEHSDCRSVVMLGRKDESTRLSISAFIFSGSTSPSR